MRRLYVVDIGMRNNKRQSLERSIHGSGVDIR